MVIAATGFSWLNPNPIFCLKHVIRVPTLSFIYRDSLSNPNHSNQEYSKQNSGKMQTKTKLDVKDNLQLFLYIICI